MPYDKLITRFMTGGHDIFITCPAKSTTYILNVLSIKLRYKLYFFHFQYQPQVSPILLYVRCKSGVTLIRRSFRDE